MARARARAPSHTRIGTPLACSPTVDTLVHAPGELIEKIYGAVRLMGLTHLASLRTEDARHGAAPRAISVAHLCTGMTGRVPGLGGGRVRQQTGGLYKGCFGKIASDASMVWRVSNIGV